MGSVHRALPPSACHAHDLPKQLQEKTACRQFPDSDFIDDWPEELHHLTPVHVLAHGRYGKVVLARYTGCNELVAVKIIDNYFGMDQDVYRECDIMKRLIGKTFCSQLKFEIKTDSCVCMGMEFYPGGSLKDLSTSGRKLSFSSTQSYIAKLIAAVRKLHMNNILHNNITLDNVLIDENGHIVLSDFGISRVIHKDWPVHHAVSCEDSSVLELSESATRHVSSVDWMAVGKVVASLWHAEIEDDDWTQTNKQDLVDLVYRLTARGPSQRASVEDICAHRFFDGVQWSDVMDRKLVMSASPQISKQFL